MIDCSICGWRHTVPCGRDDCPHDAATHFATIATALDNAVANGCMEELSKMSDENIAYDLARLDAGCERLPIEIIKAGVRAWRAPQPDDQQARIYEEISEVEHWIGGMPGQKAGVPRLRGLREAAAALLARVTELEQENADHKSMRLAHHMQDKRLGIAADHLGHFHNVRADAAEARAAAAEAQLAAHAV